MNLRPSSPPAGNRTTGDPAPPVTAEDFAGHVIFAICQASVTPSVGRRAYDRCMQALALGATARMGFRHPAKADAVDRVWRERDRLFRDYAASNDKLGFLSTLPWIGPVTKRILARRLGLLPAPDHRAAA
ncbi:hypothetical protein [Microvirga thermotolerans]|uniref:Uncharacterized protein n=1 Tax=Microvirga thermotolerans TaxID=2651334 RepID=A0A5P9JTU0_9HYPH|nr:hypothetical protein [Microvirga thermotolerans]QFU15531.1 hypothetical protein GDR74_04500 [Microvirga thermotolerans]